MVVLLVLLTIAVAVGAYLYLQSKSAETRQLPSKTVSPKKADASSRPAALREAPKVKSEPKIDQAPSPPVAEPAAETPSVEEHVEQVPPAEPEPKRKTVRDVEGLRRGLDKSRRPDGFFGRIAALLRGKKEIGADIAAQVEEVLLTSDVGVQTTQIITDRIRESLSRQELSDPNVVWDALRAEAQRILSASAKPTTIGLRAKPTVILLVGVNGAGKTTTIGKLATRFKAQGHSVLLAAGDTFRAAAVQQLCVWGNRIGVEVVHGKDGADPGSVIFEAVRKAQETGTEVVIADTAGRLHTKTNLMAELKKVVKTTAKAMEGAPHEVLLVVDATNGQNAVAQAKEFCQELPVSGMVLTKLDGTAKGGFVVGIAAALELPVKLIGLGEKATDLHDFDAEDFVEALLGVVPEGTSV